MPWKVQDGSKKAGEIVANRRPIHCFLEACLALESTVLTFDLFLPLSRMITCTESSSIELWNLEDYRVIERLGVTGAFNHKGPVRDCSFNKTGTHFVTASEDAKIFLWHFEKKKGIHKMNGHLGPVLHVMFSDDDKFLYSSSVDGKICMWDWEKNQIMYSFLRHPTAVHSFHFSEECPERLVSGCHDGSIRIWDMKRMKEMDVILPNDEKRELDMTYETSEHHNGAVSCVEFSPHSMVLASGSLDGTCKLWNVISYARSPEILKEENDRAKSINLDRMINVFDEELDIKDTELYLGEATFPSSYHADLIATLEHEGPVTSLTFSPMADLVVTGSLDCTCRVWSAGTGILLFQINVPSPVYKIHIDDDYVMTCICQNRVLVFQIKIALKESDLPIAYLKKPMDVEESEYHLKRITRVRDVIHRFDVIHGIQAAQAHLPPDISPNELTDTVVEAGKAEVPALNIPTRVYRASSLEKMTSTALAMIDTIVSPVPSPNSIRKIIVKIDDLRKLMAHGSISPTALYSILEDYDTVKRSLVVRNLETFKISPMQVLRMIGANKFPTASLLKVLEDKQNAQIIGMLINKGAPIAEFMEKLGVRSKSRQEQIEAYELLNQEDIIDGGKMYVTEIPSFDDEVSRVASPTDKNRIIHFSPAETIRLMRDMGSPSPELRKRVNPFFARQIQAASNNRGRMNYFRGSLTGNTEFDIQSIRYGIADSNKRNKYLANNQYNNDSDRNLIDPLNVKSYGGAGGFQYFNPSQFAVETSKDHEEPFIFETRALAKYDKMILAKPTRRYHAPAQPQNLRFNDMSTFENSVFKSKKTGTLYKRYAAPDSNAAYYNPGNLAFQSRTLGGARMGAPQLGSIVPGLSVRFQETTLGVGRHRGSLGLSHALTTKALIRKGPTANVGVGKASKQGKFGKPARKPLQDVYTQKFLLKKTQDDYFQQVLIGKTAYSTQ